MHDLDVYGRKLVKLPTPQYIVFYNGKEKIPDDQTLLLSDAFECDSSTTDMEPAIECKARVLNVNDTLRKLTALGYDAELCVKVLEKK